MIVSWGKVYCSECSNRGAEPDALCKHPFRALKKGEFENFWARPEDSFVFLKMKEHNSKNMCLSFVPEGDDR